MEPDMNGDDKGAGGGGGKAANKRLSVERIYQKKTQLEHILLRPDSYIGSVEAVTQVYRVKWVLSFSSFYICHRNGFNLVIGNNSKVYAFFLVLFALHPFYNVLLHFNPLVI